MKLLDKKHEIKFCLQCKITAFDELNDKFDEIGKLLNIRFDKNFNIYSPENENIYEFRDLTNQNQVVIEKEIDSFFNFSFNNIIDCSLFKFLVLKVKEEFIILANIHSFIFDYSLINDLYNFFNDGGGLHFNIRHYYDYLKKYLSSSNFKKDLNYWKAHLSDIGEYIKYYNVKTSNYSAKKITLPNFSLKNNISKFDFIASVFSLYLARIDNTKGCLFKTSISGKFAVSSLLKIDYQSNISFIDHLNNFCEVYNQAIEHTLVDIENYADFESYYSIYDFSDMDNIDIKTGENSALTLNVFSNSIELVYNTNLFSDVYIDHLLSNIIFVINNISESSDVLCKNIDLLSDKEKSLINNFSKGKSIDVDKNKSFSKAFRENAIKYSDEIAIDDGINQISYGELEHSSNSIAHVLQKDYRVCPNTCIALILPRNYHFPELVLAINKIGATFVPVDLDYPIKRIEHMLNISQCQHIITTHELSNLYDFNVN